MRFGYASKRFCRSADFLVNNIDLIGGYKDSFIDEDMDGFIFGGKFPEHVVGLFIDPALLDSSLFQNKM